MRLPFRIAAAGAFALVAANALAATPDFDNWYLFDAYQDMADSSWVDENLEVLSFDIVLNAPALLKVTDAGLAGDRFEVFANGISLGATSLPGDAGDDSKDLDFDAAYADPRWSHRVYALDAGSYSITGKAIAFVPDVGAATGAIMLTAVPEPQTWALLGAGLAMTGLALRRRSA
ncbi:MAG: PEP-CTERM sorting domain-containing protein [Betaproteobacteria bacterium]|nr:PEP-CTERM sorting domain-containing protein [Betaproteobacteria bacterium]